MKTSLTVPYQSKRAGLLTITFYQL